MFFEHQVAGHKDQLSFYPGDKSKLIKCCDAMEIKFYSDIQELIDLPLKPFLPRLFEIRDDGIVISNLSHNFKKPNIIDIKLGTKLFDRNASQEKKDRMQNVADTTTSGSLGFRICGMKVFQISSGDYDVFDGGYGRSLRDDNVLDGFTRFFKYSTKEDIISIRNSMQKLEVAYENSKVVMVGASLLIIYEGSDSIRCIPTVNLIDFAHSGILIEGAEKDYSQERQGVLLGLKNIARIINSIST